MKRVLYMAGVSCLLALAIIAYVYILPGPLDLSLVEPFHQEENYVRLIERATARPAPDGCFTFCVTGDTRSNFEVARMIMTHAAAESPAFILSDGDIVRSGAPEELAHHHMALVQAVAPIPVIPAPGNHEHGPNRDFAPFKAIYSNDQFSFDYAECRFIGINNTDGFPSMGYDDLAYLEQELAKPGARHAFVILHVPPLFLEKAVDCTDGRGFRWNSKRFRALMSKYKVDGVFAGHIHGIASTNIDCTRYTITAGGGAPLTDRLKPEDCVNNYVVVHVTPDEVKMEAVRFANARWTRTVLE